MFADDIKIAYFIPRGSQDCWLHRIQKDLDALSLWSTNSQLEFSPSKCLALHLWCSPSKTALTLCGNSIPVADRTTDLGIRYSCSLNFTNQALYQVAKARQISYLILRSFHLETTKLALFKQRVRPILEYCAFMASLLTKRCRLAIEGVQRRFTRLLLPPGCLTNYRERCGVFRLDPLWLRRLKLNLIFLHGLVHQKKHVACDIPSFVDNSTYNLRNNEYALSCCSSRTSLHSYSFFSMYPRIWNRLPLSLRMISDYNTFRRQLFAFLSFETVNALLDPQLPPYILFEQGLSRI
jgi:hypothetical protein